MGLAGCFILSSSFYDVCYLVTFTPHTLFIMYLFHIILVRHLDGELVFRLGAESLNISGAIIPEEPMWVLQFCVYVFVLIFCRSFYYNLIDRYLLFNTAISSTWGFPSPCPADCPCDCFDCRKLECSCAVPSRMCKNLPAHMLIDYIRVYQATG